jgi:type VI secretion system protein ImpL
MKSLPIFARALAILILWLVLCWFIGSWLHLHGSNLWLLRIGLAVLGLAGFAGFLWLHSRSQESAAGGDEVDLLLHEAGARLQAGLGSSATVSGLPAIFLLGDSGTAKTTTVLQSGLEPELLAGQVYQGDAVAPTRSLNLWLARQWLLIDPAGGLLADRAARQGLLHKLAPLKLKSVLQGGAAAPRAAVVCIECESFLAAGAAETMTARARVLRETLGEISHLLGIRLPVYVLFTKMDRLAHFFEYVANLTEDEAGQVLGATLPMAESAAGVYAEREAKRLNEVFSNLAFSLSDHRPDFLAREHDPAKLPSLYEFPREFRKMRAVLIQFLVDLCRPSQLRANPFLRGLYFTGVRPVTLSDAAPAALSPQPQQRAFDAGATRVFVAGGPTVSPEAARQVPNVRRVPQWVFLTHLFSDVILNDRAALGSSSSSVKLNFWRRAFLIAAGALGLLLAAAWIVSFAGNDQLKSAAVAAARAAQSQDVVPDAAPEVARDQLASAESLRRLEDLRQSLATVSDYQRGGHPLRLGWGLYIGDQIYAPLYRVYFGLFRRLLLGPIQDNLVDLLLRPTANPDRGYVYNALKAYLITTSNPDQSTTSFLPPVLATHWLIGRPIDPERAALAGKQFLFYSQELRLKNPYPNFAAPDATATQVSRAFLKQSASIEPLYQVMLANASRQNPALIFNQQYPGSAEVVVNAYPVPGVFTKPGWIFMQKAIQNPKEYFNGEAWVLGPDTYANLDPAKMQQDLQQRYQGDFVKTWREFLHAGKVVGFNSIPDAAQKLSKLSGNQSALLSLLCVVSENTAVDVKSVSDLFQPPQQVVPSGCRDHLAAPGNTAYMDGLNKLLSSLQALLTNPSNDAFRSDALTNALSADSQVRQLARNFPVDKDGAVDSTTETLLADPIEHVKRLLAGVPTDEANGAAKAFCGQFRVLMAKYPFQPSSSTDANAQEVSAIFKPMDGALWKLYQDTMQKYLLRQGNEFVAKPGNPAATPAFVKFFNSAAQVSAAFFPNNSPQLQLAFSVRVNPTEDVQEVTLTLGAQTLHSKGSEAAPQSFSWPGSPPEARLRVKFTGGTDLDFPGSMGPWAVFHFFSHFEHWQAGSPATIDWTLRAGNDPYIVPKSGRPATVSLVLDTGAAPDVFRPGFFAGLTCVAPAVR